MKTGFFHIARGVTAIFAILSGSISQGQDVPRFRSASEARAYLAENPAGPFAREAFRIMVGDEVAREYSEYPRDGRVPGRSRAVARASGLTPAQVEAGFDELSAYY